MLRRFVPNKSGVGLKEYPAHFSRSQDGAELTECHIGKKHQEQDQAVREDRDQRLAAFKDSPALVRPGDRVRFVLINDTMMEHPIHLHGLWSELENGHGEYRPYKHTINVKPGEKLSYLVSADTPGRWAYHCHLLYHMELGMFREVRVT